MLSLEGHGVRNVAELVGVDRKPVRCYVAAAEAARLTRDAGGVGEAVTDELVCDVVEAIRPARRNGTAPIGAGCWSREEQIWAWMAGGHAEPP